MGVSASIYGQRWESAGLCTCTPLIKRLLASNLHTLYTLLVSEIWSFQLWERHVGGGSVSDGIARTKKSEFRETKVIYQKHIWWLHCVLVYLSATVGVEMGLCLFSDGFLTVWLLTDGAKWRLQIEALTLWSWELMPKLSFKLHCRVRRVSHCPHFFFASLWPWNHNLSGFEMFILNGFSSLIARICGKVLFYWPKYQAPIRYSKYQNPITILNWGF